MMDATVDTGRDASGSYYDVPADFVRSDVSYPLDTPLLCPTDEDGVQREVLLPRCATALCHTATSRAGELDLESPDLFARLSNAPAAGCAGQRLIVPGDPEHSYLYRKMADPHPACGDPMPPLDAGALGLGELECVRAWLRGPTQSDAGEVSVADVARMDASADVAHADTGVDAAHTDTGTDVVRPDAIADAAVRDVPAPMDTGHDARSD